jgi:hypothetical protein
MTSESSTIGTGLTNLAGFPEAQRGRLAEDLFQLRKVDADLPDAALRYVLDGVGADVLLALARSQDAGQALQLAGTTVNYLHQTRQTARAKFFDLIAPDADAVAVYRLAEVYDAAARPCRVGSHWQSPLKLPDWLGPFLTRSPVTRRTSILRGGRRSSFPPHSPNASSSPADCRPTRSCARR